MNSRSPFQIAPPSKACSRLAPPTSRSPRTISARPNARPGVMRSRSTRAASSAVHSGRLPGISTEAWVAGAKKKPV